jgi:hypothetical protein
VQGSVEWAWLNRAVLAFEGIANPGTGLLMITASAFAPIPRIEHA